MIRNDLCYQKLPVTIVGMGSGTIYANLGGTHLTQEDVSVARSIPNMQILIPCDPDELSECIKYCAKNKKGPIYLKIGKSGEKNFTRNSEKWAFGKIRKIKSGNKTAIISCGPIIRYAFGAINNSSKDSVSIYSAHTSKTFDYNGLKKFLTNIKQ